MLNKLSIIITAILFSLTVKGQMQMSLRIAFADTPAVKKYEPDTTQFKYKAIEMQAGEYTFESTAALRILNSETITQVDLVYSDYPPGEDMSELNRLRIIELYKYCPNAFNRQIITWRKIRQTGVKNNGDLKKYFHGFVIYYRPLIPFRTEKKYFQDILAGREQLKDSTILKVINRNTGWKEMLCVTDVTGSMSPYTVQLMMWAKMNEAQKTFRQFVFFNDNDEKSNDQSKTLDTSGIWSLESFDADKVFNKMMYSMENGNHYENNLEAIFYAVKKYPGNIKNIVMIADNWEDPCDMSLLPKLKSLKIPVRIIICGVDNVINTRYLDIAYATNGSVHTMEDDLLEMGKMNEGKVFTISGLKYKITGGKFIKQ